MNAWMQKILESKRTARKEAAHCLLPGSSNCSKNFAIAACLSPPVPCVGRNRRTNSPNDPNPRLERMTKSH